MINPIHTLFHRHTVSMKEPITHPGNYGPGALRAALALTLVLVLVGNTAFAASQTKKPDGAFTLKPYSATYKASIKGMPFGGSGERSLRQNADGTWTLEFSADAAFFGMKETSHFASKGLQLIASQYVQQRTGLGNKPTEYATFDWSRNKVNWQQGDRQWSMDLKPETLDNLSYQLKLRMDLAAAQGQPLNYDVADDDEVYQRTFTIEGEEILKTDLGNLKTVRVKIQRDSDERATWIWFAKNHDYFLVKLLQEEKGTAYTIEIKEAAIDGKPLKKKQTTKLSERPKHP
ncbi:DUF3108 domain-containing protein [Thalassotalea sp. G20_0]|uniref:DUF3108 domain-containing protein n=1 Tax=Thalassotalea sp. G20_0 TaxID=2821093 RepID=UPI001ADD6163|nr:DUF3108 domain-containing protein [Thalassotalea sp. G20_0]MBO9495748.1 DUF3108 domain-containing protein [Thalassotalea sp. G20_0]